jgi:hypothetical protein
MNYIIDNFIVVSCALGFLFSSLVWVKLMFYRRIVKKIDITMQIYRDIQAQGSTEFAWSIDLLSQIEDILTGE